MRFRVISMKAGRVKVEVRLIVSPFYPSCRHCHRLVVLFVAGSFNGAKPLILRVELGAQSHDRAGPHVNHHELATFPLEPRPCFSADLLIVSLTH
jgi:hypothetical protein